MSLTLFVKELFLQFFGKVVIYPCMCVGVPKHLVVTACLSSEEIWVYSKQGEKDLTEISISDLIIYDKPKELSEFKKAGFMTEENWLAALYPNTHCHYEAWTKKFEIIKPPQSWCYVERLGDTS